MSKDSHFTGQPVYSQVLKLLDKEKILQISRETKGSEAYVKRFEHPACKGNSVKYNLDLYTTFALLRLVIVLPKFFFGLVMVLPRQGNTITIRLVIRLPTRKFFGNPASQTKTAIFGE